MRLFVLILVEIGYCVKNTNCLIKNLLQSESLPHLKIYSKISQFSPGDKDTEAEMRFTMGERKKITAALG
jgi:hypothetical protein